MKLLRLFAIVGLSAVGLSAKNASDPTKVDHSEPVILKADPRLNLLLGPERLVMADGLQPSMICTAKGTLIVQAQLTTKPLPAKRISYPSAIMTVVSRDGGGAWTEFPRPAGQNGLNFEGGVIQLRSGRILALDTYVTPGPVEGTGSGQLYFSDDDWRTLSGPVDIAFTIPGVNYYGSTDDYGRSHAAARLHRRILELPNGDLLTTLYGWFHGDQSPVYYMPTLWKTRSVLLRSSDQGRNWHLVATIAADPDLTPEGFAEPVLVRISAGPHAGRLRCYMRTGRDLYETWSDDEGATWVKARPVNFGVIDIHRTSDWAEMFRGVTNKDGTPIDLEGNMVDPDVIELRSGVLVCAVGVRVPARACWPRAGVPRNGDYLAFSLDHGETWSHVVQIVSGVLTTHYMAIEETPTDNAMFVTYDLGDWGSGKGRSIFGRPLRLELTPLPRH
ncbi:MAG: sialidase family protein [Opitutaceae bacterium]